MAVENLNAIEKALHLPEGSLQTAIESQDVIKIELPELEIFKKEDYNTRIENLKGTFQTQGRDFQIKEAKETYGLDFEGKTIDKFADALKAKFLKESSIEPDSRVKELQTDLEKLRANLAEKDVTISNINESFKKKETQRSINDTLLSKINIETSIPKEDILLILKSKYEIDLEGDKMVFKKDGEVLKNQTTLNPLGVDDIFNEFLPTYAKEATGGKAKGDNTGSYKAGTIDAFTDEMNKKGIRSGSQEFNNEMQKRIKEKTLTY